MKILEQIFSVKNENKHKCLRFFGLKFKFRKKKEILLLENINNKLNNQGVFLPGINNIETSIRAAVINSNLAKYRGIYEGRDIVIVGGGPTVKYFEAIQSAINISINRAFLLDNIKFDYIFTQDHIEDDWLEPYLKYDCKKFVGIIPREVPFKFDQWVINRIKPELYVMAYEPMGPMPWDVTMEPVADLYGTAFSAVQIALLTNPRRIYIVGMDCSNGHIFEKNSKLWTETNFNQFELNIRSWKRIKTYLEYGKYKTRLISVNPVGLKGIFEDVYTQSYVDEHPELLNQNIKILGGNKNE